MTHITKSAIEQLAIERLEALGYQYVYALDIAPAKPSNQSRDQHTAGLTVERLMVKIPIV